MKVLNALINHFKKNRFYYIVFFAFFIPRIIGLGYDVWNIDAHHWDYRSDRFIQKLLEWDLPATYQKYHPGVTVMWLSGLSKKLFYIFFESAFGYSPSLRYGLVYPELFFVKSLVAKFPLVLIISLGYAFCIDLLKRLALPTRYLIILVIFLSLEPFPLGISRFYHLSGIETCFGFLSVILAYYYTKIESKKYLIASAVFLGLSFLTKTSGILYLPLIVLILSIDFINFDAKYKLEISAKKLINFIKIGAVFSIIFAGTVLVLFPALWIDPVNVLTRMYKEGILETGFEGGPGATLTNLPYIFYIEKLVLRSTVLFTVSFFVGSFYINRVKKTNFKRLLWLSLIFVVYFIVVMTIPSKLKDRYLASLYPFALILSSYGLYYLTLKIKRFWLVVVSILIYFFISIYSYYPSISAYHTDLLWGYRGIPEFNVIKNRGEFYLTASRFLNNKDGEDAYNKSLVITSSQRYLSTAGYLGSVHEEEGTIGNNRRADYFLTNYTQTNKLPTDRKCTYIRSFGPRFPFYFEYLKLYQCSNI